MAIKHKRKLTTGYTWLNGDLAEGQIGMNVADQTLHIADGAGDIETISTDAVNAGLYEPIDSTILKDADIGVTVQAYDSTYLVDADIGVNVQAYDSTILVDADIGVNVQAYDSTILVDADIGVNVQAYDSTILVDADIGVNVQSYDINTRTLKDNLAAAVAPSISSDNTQGYAVGSEWIDTTADKAYVALDVSTGAAVWTETTGSGGGGTPGGADTQIQYNNGGVFGADAAMVFNDTSKLVTLGGDLTVDNTAPVLTLDSAVTGVSKIDFLENGVATGRSIVSSGASGNLIVQGVGCSLSLDDIGGTVALTTQSGSILLNIGNGADNITVESTGLLSSSLGASYAALVTADGDLTDKKYVDDAITAGGGATDLDGLTDVNTVQHDDNIHRYWRFICDASLQSSFVLVHTMELYDAVGGPDLAQGKTYSESSFSNVSVKGEKAFDNDNSTYWSSIIGDVVGAWCSVDLGVGNEKDIIGTAIGMADANDRYATAFRIQYSDDNVAWTTKLTVTGFTAKEFNGADGAVLTPWWFGKGDGTMLVLNSTTGEYESRAFSLTDMPEFDLDAAQDGNVLTFDGSLGKIILDLSPVRNWIDANGGVDFSTAPGGTSNNSFAIGNGAGDYSGGGTSNNIIMGTDAYVVGGSNCIVIGPNATDGVSGGSNIIAIGANSAVHGTDGVAIGTGAGTVNGLQIKVNQTASASTLSMTGTGTVSNTGTTAQFVMPSYTVATLPTGTTGGMIFVTDETGGSVPAFYDGTNWRRCTDRAIVS